jgi:hypothetical protein
MSSLCLERKQDLTCKKERHKMITIKTLLTGFSILAATLAFAPIASQAIAANTTSSLIISNDHFVPNVKKATVTHKTETDSMPITEDTPYRSIHDALNNTPHTSTAATTKPTAVAPMHGHDLQTLDVVNTPMRPAAPIDTAASWRARNGESLQGVLTRWADRVGVTYEWTTSDTSKLHRSYSDFGSHEEAVYKLLVRESKPSTYIQEHTFKVHKRAVNHAVKKNN